MSEQSSALPLLPGFEAERPLFETGSSATQHLISHQEFIGKATRLSRTLPSSRYLINLCDDRYWFALAFAAGLIRGSVSLFPANRLAATCHEIARDYSDVVCVSDSPIDGLELPLIQIKEPGGAAHAAAPMPLIAADTEAFVAFTSGSTGRPRPHPKYWGDLVGCAAAAARRFGFTPDSSIIATVPPQHMYGLELSIMVPLTVGLSVTAARPFFPADIRAALGRAPGARILVTTPIHLAACVDAGLDWPAIDMVISATAPLSRTLAERAESALSTRVFEIYGSTESGSIASRHTCQETAWRWYDSVVPIRDGDRIAVTADFLHGPVPLADVLQLERDGSFQLLGREAEMIKVGGKRASLADLSLKLNAIDGVSDAVFVVPDEQQERVERLALIAVAPGMDRQAIIAGLAGRIDPVFYPRRIVFVDRLPRNAAGKLVREDLLRLLDTARDQGSEGDAD